MEAKKAIATTSGLLPIQCPACHQECTAEMPKEMDRLVSQCCGATIPGTQNPQPEES